jgi:hypothetical protein
LRALGLAGGEVTIQHLITPTAQCAILFHFGKVAPAAASDFMGVGSGDLYRLALGLNGPLGDKQFGERFGLQGSCRRSFWNFDFGFKPRNPSTFLAAIGSDRTGTWALQHACTSSRLPRSSSSQRQFRAIQADAGRTRVA